MLVGTAANLFLWVGPEGGEARRSGRTAYVVDGAALRDLRLALNRLERRKRELRAKKARK